MSNLVREVSDLANELLESHWKLTHAEALAVAVKIQQNRMFKDAFVLDTTSPTALEGIVIELRESNAIAAME